MSSKIKNALLLEYEDVRESIIEAILIAAKTLSDKHEVMFRDYDYRRGNFNRSIIPSAIETWRLLETLSILSIINSADKIVFKDMPNLFKKFGPMAFIENAFKKFLWYQPQICKGIAGLKAIPDIVITDSQENPNERNILNIIECKHRLRMGAPVVRAEFGKAHDLRVLSYLIWTWRTPKDHVIQGAKKLGIDLVPVGFDSHLSKDFIVQPHSFFVHISGEIARSRSENSFAITLRKTDEELKDKLKQLR